jgi:hypothetical protein
LKAQTARPSNVRETVLTPRKLRLAGLVGATALSMSFSAAAQAPPPGYGAPAPSYGAPAPGYTPPAPGYGAPAPSYGAPAPGYRPMPGYGAPPYGYRPYTAPQSNERTPLEIGTLYGVSVAYGAGLGIWFDAEVDEKDPGVALIMPAVLGVAAPAGVYFLDQPSMPKGMPAAIAAGLALGGGEGVGIASYQFVSAKKADAWGFRGLSRATALGATIGGVGGYALGYFVDPDPQSSVAVTSGAAWGAFIGGAFGYGASKSGIGYGLANDDAGLGGLIGYNLGMAAMAGLTTVYEPTWNQLAWMWAGGGIGAVVSLPVYLLYGGSNSTKRGLLFTGTAVTLGIVAGGVFASGAVGHYSVASAEPDQDDGAPGPNRLAVLTSVAPFTVPGGGGLELGGVLF